MTESAEGTPFDDPLLRLDWDLEGEDTGDAGHNLHPYPAKFPPQIPRQLISELSRPGDLVLDCFGGSGTTALEAVRSNRRAISLDANPVAQLIASVKLAPPGAEEREALVDFERSLELTSLVSTCPGGPSCPVYSLTPQIPNRDRWFSPITVHELSHIRSEIDTLRGDARRAAMLALGQAAAHCSFQESETRYVSRPRRVAQGETLKTFRNELRRLLNRLPDDGRLYGENGISVLGDARLRESYPIEDGSVQLVVTSPPYPNAYDYHLYHRFRLFWTGQDPADLRRVEIGSHLRQQAILDPIADYERDMRQVIGVMRLLLADGGHLALVVGDGIYKGVTYRTASALRQIGLELGFETRVVINRNLPNHRRSVTVAGRRLKQEQIVILRKLPLTIIPPHWRMAPYEEDIATREVQALLTSGTSCPLQRVTFASQVAFGGRRIITRQAMLEKDDSSRRKNSTYVTHGLHRYKGKFYPQLGRALLNITCPSGGLVVDPFTGSGTMPLEAHLLELRAHGIELNPVGAAVARAKIQALRIPADALAAMSNRVLRSPAGGHGPIAWEQFTPESREELESWFARPVLVRISNLLARIRSVLIAPSPPEAPFAPALALLGEVHVSDLIREVSHQEPSDLRIRRRSTPLEDAPVEQLFDSRWRETLRRLQLARPTIERLREQPWTIVNGDSTLPSSWPTAPSGKPLPVDAIVSSPPYASALPYIDTDRLSIAAVFGVAKGQRSELERALVGSREITTNAARDWEHQLLSGQLSSLLPASTTSFLEALNEAVKRDKTAGFRKRQMPAVLTRYFCDMSKVLRQAASSLRPGGQAWLVLGDSRTIINGEQWRIPTISEIVSIGKHHGLELVESLPITVTRENMRHAKNAITSNTIIHLARV